jgi:hypothetical protein
MAKLKATPKSYAEAKQTLGNRDSMRIGNNTYLEWGKFGTYIAVRLHGTEIVKFHENDTVTLHTGGYRTVTTKDLAQFVAELIRQGIRFMCIT